MRASLTRRLKPDCGSSLVARLKPGPDEARLQNADCPLGGTKGTQIPFGKGKKSIVQAAWPIVLSFPRISCGSSSEAAERFSWR